MRVRRGGSARIVSPRRLENDRGSQPFRARRRPAKWPVAAVAMVARLA